MTTQKTAESDPKLQTSKSEFTDPFRPTRLEVLQAVAQRNSERTGARFGLGNIIQEAESAVDDGDLEWREGRDSGRWLTEQGMAKIA